MNYKTIVKLKEVIQKQQHIIVKNKMASKCKSILNQNEIIINKTSYKKNFINNNKSINHIISNLLTLLKNNPNLETNDQKNISQIKNYMKKGNVYNIDTIKIKLYEIVKLN